MDGHEQVPITLSRDDLYELVWSKPMTELAKDFGISDVALAKRCRRLGIPVPGRGYWARVDAGQTPYRPKLPKREAQWHDQSALTVAPSEDAPLHALASLTPEQGFPQAAGQETTSARIAALAFSATCSILETLPTVKRTAIRLKHPQRTEFTFQRGERTGPIVDLNVTQDASERALLLADSLLRAADTLGWIFDDPADLRKKQRNPERPHSESSTSWRDEGSTNTEKVNTEPNNGRLLVEGEQVSFRIEERFRDEPCEPTAAELAREKREYGYHAPRKIAVATGNLRVVRLDTYRTYGEPDRRSWYDRKGSRVEDQMREILLGFYQLALSIKERRAEDERKARERQEQERRQKELEAIQEANQKLIKQLETDAGAWHRARYLRRYIQAARKSLGQQPLGATFHDQVIDFLTWAETYVNQLDPLHSAPRTGEFEKNSYHYQSDLDRMKEAFSRLFGGEWTRAWKVGKDYTPKPKSEPHWYYGEKSVFAVDLTEAKTEFD
jgi:hypothetical protein